MWKRDQHLIGQVGAEHNMYFTAVDVSTGISESAATQ
jgi:hypothetical protein